MCLICDVVVIHEIQVLSPSVHLHIYLYIYTLDENLSKQN